MTFNVGHILFFIPEDIICNHAFIFWGQKLALMPIILKEFDEKKSQIYIYLKINKQDTKSV